MAARKSIVELEAEALANLPDNVTGLISPADVRVMFTDFLNAVRPAYGYLTKSTGSAQSLGTTAAKLIWTAAQDSDINQSNSSAATGRITRLERGSCGLTFNADADGANGRIVTFILYKNGAATDWRASVTCGGAGKPVSCGFNAVDYADPAAYYEMFATCDTDATSITLSKLAFVLNILPVNSYA
jgi:hypothetical protein